MSFIIFIIIIRVLLLHFFSFHVTFIIIQVNSLLIIIASLLHSLNFQGFSVYAFIQVISKSLIL